MSSVAEMEGVDIESGSKSINDEPQPSGAIEPSSSSSSVEKSQPKEDRVFEVIAVVFGIIFTPIAIGISVPFLVIGVVVSMPLLSLILVPARVVKALRNDEDTAEVANVQRVIIWARSCLFMAVIALLVIMGVFQGVVRTVSSLKHGMIVGVHVSQWVNIVCMLCGFHLLSFGMFAALHESRDEYYDLHALQDACLNIGDCLLFWWAEHEVMKRVPDFKSHELLGLRTQKWIKHILFILIGINIITLLTQAIVGFMRTWFVVEQRQHPDGGRKKHWWSPLIDNVLPERYLLYYAVGMRYNVNLLLNSLMLLLTWVLYFGPNLSAAPGVVRFVTLTFLCLFVFSFLWLLKALVLLSWEAQAIYVRLGSGILQAGKQLYFLGIIFRYDCDIFNLLYTPTDTSDLSVVKMLQLANDYGALGRCESDKEDEWGVDGSASTPTIERRFMAEKRRKTLQGNLLLRKDYTPTIYDILLVAQTFLATKDALPKDIHLPLIIDKLKAPQESSANQIGDATEDAPPQNPVSNSKECLISMGKLMRLMNGKDNSAQDSNTEEAKDSKQDSSLTNNSIKEAKDSKQDSSLTNNSIKEAIDSKQDSSLTNNSIKEAIDSKQDSSLTNNSIKEAIDSKHDSSLTNNSIKEAKDSKQDSSLTNNSIKEAKDSNVNDISTEEAQDSWGDYEKLHKFASFKEKLSCQDFQLWMEKAVTKCVQMGNILSNAKEAVGCLNKIISCLLIGATFIMWLILTGLASTQVLVIIASPLLAATFIFGDTCKSLFQGIMYVYVVHPYNVGDLCAIDGKLMKVKSIGVWKTIFSDAEKIGAKEEAIFTNSELANKSVINHKSEFECTDSVEFHLEIKNSERIEKLASKIKGYLDNSTKMFTTGSHSVALRTSGDNMKIAVRFVHNIKLEDATTYFECIRKKDEQRTTFILHVQKVMKMELDEEARGMKPSMQVT